jgi:uncharacterized protein (TIRG00374 family)
MKANSRTVFLSIAAAAVIYLGLAVWSNFGDVSEAFKQFTWWYFPIILALTFTNYLIRFGTWQFYLSGLGITNVPRKDSFLIYLSGFAMSITPGKLGEVIRAFLLKRSHNIPISKTGGLVLVDRLTDLAALVIIASVGAIQFSYGLKLLAVVAVGIIAVLFVISHPAAMQKCLKLLSRIPALGKRSAKIEELYKSTGVLLRPNKLIPILMFSTISWSFEAFGFWLAMQGLGLETTIWSAAFIYAFSTIIGALSILPGGLGLTEGSMAGLLVLINVPKAAATATTFIIRVATLWFGVAIGAVCLAIFERRFKPQGEADMIAR